MIWGSHIVVLDEPAAALGVRQTEIVLSFIEQLRDHGVACIFISHNMQHVMRVADRIVLMRLGEKIFDGPAASTTASALVAMMTGATVATARLNDGSRRVRRPLERAAGRDDPLHGQRGRAALPGPRWCG